MATANLTRFTKLMSLGTELPIAAEALPNRGRLMTVAAGPGRKPHNIIINPVARHTPTEEPSRAAAPSFDGSGRATRAANSTSGSSGTRSRQGAGTSKVDRPGSRFAHLARAFEVEAEPEPEAMPVPSALYAPQARATEMRRAIIANQGRIPGADTPEKAAAFIAAAAAKARGQKPPAPPVKAAVVKHDMTTPEGVAAYVHACAAKARGPAR